MRKILKKTKINKLILNNKVSYKLIASTINQCDTSYSLEYSRNVLEHLSPKPSGSSYSNNEIKQVVYDLQIIIPAYNVEQYIDDCLTTVLNQETDYSYLVVVINDGSTDRTKEILEKYEGNRVKVINQSNKGFSGARNTGLQEINSRYLMFVDSDDRLEKNAIQLLLKAAYKNDSDVVEGGYYRFKNKHTIISKTYHANEDDIKALGNLRGFPWGKVFKSSLFENIKFPEGYWYEDVIFSYLVFPRCKKSSTISDIVYWYRRNSSGISFTSYKSNKCADAYWIIEQMLEDMKKLNIKKTQDIYDNTLKQIYLCFARTQLMPEEIKKSLFTLLANMIHSEFTDFKTKKKEYKVLEIALRNNDYISFFMFCTFY